MNYLTNFVPDLSIPKGKSNVNYYKVAKRRRTQLSYSKLIEVSTLAISSIRATNELCPCGRCKGFLLDWDGREEKNWPDGACVYTLFIRYLRLDLLNKGSLKVDSTRKELCAISGQPSDTK